MAEQTEFESAPASDAVKHAPAFVLRIERWLTILAGIILFATMTMTTVDVIGRYVFDRPLGFAYEVTELLMATVFFVALASVTLRGEHIAIGLFNAMWRGRVGAARDLVIAAAVVIATGFLCYRMALFTSRFYNYGDITNMLKFPLYPVAAVGTVGVGFACLAALVLAADALRRFIRGAR